MKTIEEAAENYIQSKYKEFALLDIIGEDTSIKDFRDDFKAGVEFAQRWIPVEEELPEIGEKVITKMAKDKRTAYGIFMIVGDVFMLMVVLSYIGVLV